MTLALPMDRSQRISAYRQWIAFLGTFVVFAGIREFANHTGLPTRFHYAAAWDRILFLGTTPTEWLQAHRAIPWDAAAIMVWASFFVVPYVVGWHQFKRGSTQAQKAIEWWKGQAMGNTPVGGASLLITGHYHQLVVQRMNTKTHIQCPSIEGGSEWFANMTGYMGMQPPGVLTLSIGSREPSGWADLEVV